MVRPERFELPTLWFVATRSIQLSYGRIEKPLSEYQIDGGCSLPASLHHHHRPLPECGAMTRWIEHADLALILPRRQRPQPNVEAERHYSQPGRRLRRPRH